MRQRDTRSYEIKKVLKKEYPQATFKVWIHKYSMGESINIRTDLLRPGTTKCLECGTEKEGYSSWCCGKPAEYTNNSIDKRREVESLLQSYQHVDRDQWGEILSGGNTYLFVDPLR